MVELHKDPVITAAATKTHLPGFGTRLRRQRKARGIKQAYLAVLVGVDQATISRWESGSIIPDAEHAAQALRVLYPEKHEDSALRRLVESSSLVVHLVTDVDHILLAASKGREAQWNTSAASLRGRCIWGAASPAIQDAELSLESNGWWKSPHPKPVVIDLDAYDSGFLPITPGRMLWERVWLSDGRPARLCTLTSKNTEQSTRMKV